MISSRKRCYSSTELGDIHFMNMWISDIRTEEYSNGTFYALSCDRVAGSFRRIPSVKTALLRVVDDRHLASTVGIGHVLSVRPIYTNPLEPPHIKCMSENTVFM